MKIVLITGIGRGIGRALAEKFLAEGYAVIGTTLSSAAPIGNANLKTFPLDLSSPESIKDCAEKIMGSGAKIDILINNAGVLFDGEETHLIADRLRKTLEVNLIGTADFTERIVPMMNKDGHIICISSQAGSITDMDHIEDSHFPYYYPAYKISKCALNMYVRTLAARLHHEGVGIIVSAVHPGWVRTDMGGKEAPTAPEEAALGIFKLAVSRPETGRFWYDGKKFPW
jgi:NAD(P)-dependent dehydrogenase (short-subunit alcohol dehydrogenase family)